ncbi:hypothetical protein ACHMW6_13275 [Pseudoduganella sp. UC29_106]|uniref:hypothetical protein n=1 Tax=Pseudoduganella sp. UC29_106 TaxID=3374553 RepID=UPI003757811A
MSQQNQPTKEQIRQYLLTRLSQDCPPPSMTDIRRQLGWGLTAAASRDDARREERV